MSGKKKNKLLEECKAGYSVNSVVATVIGRCLLPVCLLLCDPPSAPDQTLGAREFICDIVVTDSKKKNFINIARDKTQGLLYASEKPLSYVFGTL